MKDKDYPYIIINGGDFDGETDYTIEYRDLPGCVVLAGTLEEAVKLGEKSKEKWLVEAKNAKDPIPKPYDYLLGNPSLLKVELFFPPSVYSALCKSAEFNNLSVETYCFQAVIRAMAGLEY